jgi:hypothetical protein
MLIGHYSAAFVAKRIEPRLPLWSLLLAAQIVDVFWALFILTGVEKASLDPSLPSNPLVLTSMPYSHSLGATFIWGFVALLVGMLSMHGGMRRLAFGIVLAATVMSHWFLDLIVHRPDLPLWGEEAKMGLGLWNWPIPAVALEVALVAASIAWMVRSRTLHSGQLRKRVVILGGILLVAQIVSILGLTPPTIGPVAIAGLVTFLSVAALGWWVEH